jgi:hypothetical protein
MLERFMLESAADMISDLFGGNIDLHDIFSRLLGDSDDS